MAFMMLYDVPTPYVDPFYSRDASSLYPDKAIRAQVPALCKLTCGQDDAAWLLVLPAELLEGIFGYLSLQNLFRCARTCRSGYEAVFAYAMRMAPLLVDALFFPSFKSKMVKSVIGTNRFAIGGEDFTMAAWVRPKRRGYGMIFAKDAVADDRMPFRFEVHEQGHCAVVGLNVPLSHGGAQNAFGAPSWDPRGTASALYSSSRLPLKEWTHVALVREGLMIQLFVNGVVDARVVTEDVAVHSSPDRALRVACRHGHRLGAQDWFPGTVRHAVVLPHAVAETYRMKQLAAISWID